MASGDVPQQQTGEFTEPAQAKGGRSLGPADWEIPFAPRGANEFLAYREDPGTDPPAPLVRLQALPT